MPDLILRGNSTPQLQSWRQTYETRQGLKGEFMMRGIDIAKMSSLATEYILLGYDMELDYKFGIAELTVRTPNGEVTTPGSGGQTIIDKWEVAVDEEKPSIFENQNFIQYAQSQDGPLGVKASSQLISSILSMANIADATNVSSISFANWVAQTKTTPLLNDDGTNYDGGTGENVTIFDVFENIYPQIQPFILDYFRGATNFVHSKYVVRHTSNVPNNYASNVADFNIEKIYTISQFLAEAQNPALWILPLPPYLAFKILNYPVPTNVWDQYLFGALKLRSNAVTAARNRIEIVQEYLIDAWPTYTYGTI